MRSRKSKKILSLADKLENWGFGDTQIYKALRAQEQFIHFHVPVEFHKPVIFHKGFKHV